MIDRRAFYDQRAALRVRETDRYYQQLLRKQYAFWVPPGLRVLEKYAVRVGGGTNHRTGLYDGVLIKENHIAAAGGILEAVRRARAYIPHTLKIEIETETLEQVTLALQAGADIIMLDNMSLSEMSEAVLLIGRRALVEASGGVNLKTIRGIAQTGVDIISVGALTHSVRSLDLGLDIAVDRA